MPACASTPGRPPGTAAMPVVVGIGPSVVQPVAQIPAVTMSQIIRFMSR